MRIRTILDAEMSEQVIWPDQADCGGLARIRAFSWKADGRATVLFVAVLAG
jgi:hypothetical protein